MNTSFQGSSEKGTETWLTPKYIIDALGPFDLDPCAHITMPWNTAATMLTIKEDGLKTSWDGYGRVFMNPPYSRTGMPKWLSKMEKHGNGIALVYASTDVDWFDYIWDSHAQLFRKGRIKFCNEFGVIPVNDKGQENSPGKGSVFAAWGGENISRLQQANLPNIIPGKLLINI